MEILNICAWWSTAIAEEWSQVTVLVIKHFDHVKILQIGGFGWESGQVSLKYFEFLICYTMYYTEFCVDCV